MAESKITIDDFSKPKFELRQLNGRETRLFSEAGASEAASWEMTKHNFVIGEPLPEYVRVACRRAYDDYMRDAGFDKKPHNNLIN